MTPQEFEIAFPKVMGWIQRTLVAYEKVAQPVASKNFKRLPLYFSRAQLEAAKFVTVAVSRNSRARTMRALPTSIHIF
jgi:hypothetical protein